MSQPVKRPTFGTVLSKLSACLFVGGTLAIGWFIVQKVTTPDQPSESSELAEAPAADSATVTLSPAKLAQADIGLDEVRLQPVSHVHTVAGRLAYHEARHIEVKTPVSGVLADVLVMPGNHVDQGQLLAIIHSPEIGQARADLLNRQAALQLVQQQVDRLRQITENLNRLFELLDRRTPLNEIEQQFRDKPLGTYREAIISAYSERFLADQLATSARPLMESGSLPRKTLQERDNQLHVTNARFLSARENAAFQVGLEARQLDAKRADAERQVLIAQNHLDTLLGFPEDSSQQFSGDSLSQMEVRAPIAGTIESRSFAKSERVDTSDALFVLANTELLYVTADIRENDFAALAVRPGQQITVVAPALHDRTFSATVQYVGREVARDSNSLPLVATIANDDGLLRPGMFVRVSIPVSQGEDVVSVQSRSVLQHEDQQFVFVPESDGRFRRVDVKTQAGNDDWVQVVEGLDVGQPIVVDAAFLLKSELLLASEE
ncbi:MAG: efflux RND transporter periplasmic adaptor subunit [Fuerstiella sp.]